MRNVSTLPRVVFWNGHRADCEAHNNEGCRYARVQTDLPRIGEGHSPVETGLPSEKPVSVQDLKT